MISAKSWLELQIVGYTVSSLVYKEAQVSAYTMQHCFYGRNHCLLKTAIESQIKHEIGFEKDRMKIRVQSVKYHVDQYHQICAGQRLVWHQICSFF